MIEVNTDVQGSYADLLQDLTELRSELRAAAEKLNIGIAGGGAHPFHHWAERRIYPAERFSALSELYGYLAKQFTVFGQHIHIGCDNADTAIRLTHELKLAAGPSATCRQPPKGCGSGIEQTDHAATLTAVRRVA
jgi:carboxylate-amine ligase